jgi:hypothetical protein
MRAHAEAAGDWLKIFLFLVDAMPAAPPPGLMDKRSMRRIHQPDDPWSTLTGTAAVRCAVETFSEFLHLSAGIAVSVRVNPHPAPEAPASKPNGHRSHRQLRHKSDPLSVSDQQSMKGSTGTAQCASNFHP